MLFKMTIIIHCCFTSIKPLFQFLSFFFNTELLFYFYLLPILVFMAVSIDSYASNHSYIHGHK